MAVNKDCTINFQFNLVLCFKLSIISKQMFYFLLNLLTEMRKGMFTKQHIFLLLLNGNRKVIYYRCYGFLKADFCSQNVSLFKAHFNFMSQYIISNNSRFIFSSMFLMHLLLKALGIALR